MIAEKKKFKDVQHLYIGCAVEYREEEEKVVGILTHKLLADDRLSSISWIPYLFKIKNMTTEDAIYLCEWYGKYGDMPHRRTYKTWLNSFGNIIVAWGDTYREMWSPMDCEVWTPEQVEYLLSKHFDLFGLIERGEAIDKMTIVR